jgi:mono/diheme cytochrome c family protein
MCTLRSSLELITLTMLCLLLLSCGGGGSSSSSDSTSNVNQAAKATAPLSYNRHTKSLIDSRCVTCHNSNGRASFALSNYAQVFAKKSAMVYVLETGVMPIPGFATLTPTERQLLLQWLEEGAAEGEVANNLPATPYNYYGHTKTIIERKCSHCHSPGEIAPFSLTNYDSVYAVRAAVSHQISSRAMPPWPPTDHYRALKNNRGLTDEERAMLMSWLNAGAPRGEPDDYMPPAIAKPDIDYNITVAINEPFTPTSRPDEYRCLMIDWPLDRTVFINAVNVIPDAKAQVHHVFAVVVDPKDVPVFEAADGADGKPGFSCWGAPSPEGALVPPRTLTVWAPGISPGPLPDGTGVRIDPGSKIAMQMHYNTINSEPEPDQSSIQMRYVDTVERAAITLFFLDVGWYPSGGMPIAADDPSVTVQYTSNLAWSIPFSGGDKIGLGLNQPFALHSVFMHQHVLGKANSLELIRADGTEIMLVDIRDWDFDWQDEYVFEEEIIVQPDDQFRLTCTWDNSASNQQFINGKQIEPQYVEFGEGTLDEMCVSYFYVTHVAEQYDGTIASIPPSVAFYQPLHLQRFNPGAYVPIELVLNAFKLQEPNTSHAAHGHLNAVESETPEHNHRSGHYHIYLDDNDDSGEHLTRWEPSTFYLLPDDIASGQHRLRVSLRNDAHEAIGVENQVIFVVNDSIADARSSTESLIDVADWKIQSASQDSLASHRPQNYHCPDNAWYEEDGALEVETGYCNYLSLSQASKAPISTGDDIHLVLWHGQLRFEEPTEAHIAVSAGGTVVWEDFIEIPSSGGVYDVTVPSVVSAQAGDSLEFHLHNHGYNTWTLLTLEVVHR